MQHLRQLVYLSSATQKLSEPELIGILEGSRLRNTEHQITGMLLYAEGSFIQVLEGKAVDLEELLRKIKRDTRHRGFLILLDRVVTDRDFDGWSMAFQRVSQQELEHIAGFQEWSAEMPAHRKNAAGVRLIESFRRTLVRL